LKDATTAEIYSVSADGGAPTRLTHNKGFDAAPSYSPDGATIVDESFGGLSTMRSDGTRYQTLRVSTDSAFTPRFSPDGKTIAFTSYTDAWRPKVQLGRNYLGGAALVLLATANARTGRVTELSNIGMATDLNTPQWLDNDHLLVLRVPARQPR
jgi:Tol biopolymer transport system component